jgi:hypothetical protein
MRKIATLVALALALGLTLAAACGPADEKPAAVQSSGKAAATGKAKPKTVPVKLVAAKTTLRRDALAEDKAYTVVKVTVTNNTSKVLEINPLYFAITGTDGSHHEADALGVDTRQLDTAKIQPHEKITGTIVAEGKFTPKTVTFTKDGFGTSYSATVS